MRLFGYYAWHSLKNQIKKLFKTWVLIFLLICFVMGALLGVGLGMLEDSTEPEDPGYTEEVPPQEELPEEPMSPQQAQTLIELVAGGVILGMFLLMSFSADKNGSKIFLMADVNLLFASPMKPQSVLLFRLMTQLGLLLLSSLYILFQLPNLVMNMGLTVWGAVGIAVAWLFTLVASHLLQVLLYTLAATWPKVKKHLRTGIYLVLGLVAGGYILFTRSTELNYYDAAVAFFNHPVTRFIPFWGWIKAICMGAITGNVWMALSAVLATVAGGAVLAVIIWRIPADFYEDAMAKSQETAELLEVAQAEKSTGFVKRKKDRSEKLRRDGMTRGRGASVFFWRILYNRFRFAHFGIFTKTSETYLVAAVAVGCLCQFAFQTDGTVPVVLTLAVLSFFRSMGNPLAEDTSKDFFRMIPEATGKKLFYSLMGGTACCLMDLLPAMVVTVFLCGSDVLALLGWCIVILSVDFYGTNVGAFIDFSVPVKAGKTIKQLVQILFIYFGLVPDIIIMVIGIVSGQVTLASLGAGALNMALGGIFLALSPLFLDPKEKPVRVLPELTAEDKKLAKKHISRLGWGCVVILVVSSVLQLLCMELLPQTPWTMWIYSFAPIYLAAMPLGILIFRSVPKVKPEPKGLKLRDIVQVAFISLFMMYGGNFLATLLTSFLPVQSQSGIMDFIMADSWLMKILVMVILAPIMEELIFRKYLIDRLHLYGGKLAVVCSALIFGLFHGNFTQAVYASALGMVLGFVYLKTGKLRYSIGIHMGVNFLGGIVSSWLLENLDLEALEDPERIMEAVQSPAFIGYICFLVFILISMVVGLVLLCRNARRVQFAVEEKELGKDKWRIAWGNPGMIVFALLCLASIVMVFFAA